MSRTADEYKTGAHRPGSTGSKLNGIGLNRNSSGFLGWSCRRSSSVYGWSGRREARMKNKYYTSRDPIKNYFPLPNEVFALGLSPGALAVYSYLMYIEDRTT